MAMFRCYPLPELHIRSTRSTGMAMKEIGSLSKGSPHLYEFLTPPYQASTNHLPRYCPILPCSTRIDFWQWKRCSTLETLTALLQTQGAWAVIFIAQAKQC
uniref:Uncharacterized protein n=1 Tax=Coccidioides posadasii RMSCC 3488 TaxID=454284 RepID=A0A0J6F9F3_COCPO|nr:hypothetical protein CPAG_05945 [Coccidioides posadasii RMSCC 3488]